MKKFVLLVVTLLITLSMTCFCYAEEGDAYDFNPENYPDRHWCFMTDEEIAKYEAIGWRRNTGTLWYDDLGEEVDFADIQVDAIQDVYNKGYSFHVIYHWLCPGEKIGKHQEQSVYVGRMKLSPEMAIAFHQTYEVPTLVTSGEKSTGYWSLWYWKNQESADPEGNEPAEVQAHYNFVRHHFDVYKPGYGLEIYLRNGDYTAYDFATVLTLESVDGEIPYCK